MKRLIRISMLTFVFLVAFSNVSMAMSYNEFMKKYPSPYIYKIVFDYVDKQRIHYFSSPAELQFELLPYIGKYGGKSIKIKKPAGVTVYYELEPNGSVDDHTSTLHLMPSGGFDGNIDLYVWNGSGFFLPLPSQILREISLNLNLGVLLSVGITIIAVMIGVVLIPRIIWKFF